MSTHERSSIYYISSCALLSCSDQFITFKLTFVSTSCGRHFLTCSWILKNAREGSLAITFKVSDTLSVTEKKQRKFEVATSNDLGDANTMYKKKTVLNFDVDLGVKVTQDVAQYALHHVIYAEYAHAKLTVATSNGLGDTFTRKYII